MKTGKTLNELAAELTRQQETKRDFIAGTESLYFNAERNVIGIEQNGAYPEDDLFQITNHTHRQIGNFTGIPAKYYDRMRADAPALLNSNVANWMEQEPKRRMLRTLDGKARAFLSDAYQRIDNYEIAETVLPALQEMGGVDLVSCEVTERKLYIKALTPKVQGEIKVGDTACAGVAIANSEIGQGAVSVAGLIYTFWCKNGCYSGVDLSRNHVGRRASSDEQIYELLKDDTRAADDKALLLKLRDVVEAAVDQVRFTATLERFAATQDDKIEGSPVKAVEELSNKYQLNDIENAGILTSLLQDSARNGLSKYGLLNAVTKFSQTVEDYDRATELEQLGGKIIELSANDWQTIAQAA